MDTWSVLFLWLPKLSKTNHQWRNRLALVLISLEDYPVLVHVFATAWLCLTEIALQLFCFQNVVLILQTYHTFSWDDRDTLTMPNSIFVFPIYSKNTIPNQQPFKYSFNFTRSVYPADIKHVLVFPKTGPKCADSPEKSRICPLILITLFT